jgi:rubrerythrin
MNIYDFAMAKEKEAESLYRQLADNTGNEGFKSIFSMLADEEGRHYSILEEMNNEVPPELSDSDILPNANEVIKKMSRKKEAFEIETDQVELYKNAQEIEKQSRDFYREKAGEVQDAFQKEIFEKLADQEQNHYVLLDNIIELVLRPEQWLENAEWNPTEEY